MKPLDLEKLERDREGVTRDGRRVVIHSIKDGENYPIDGVVYEKPQTVNWDKDGRYLFKGDESVTDLFNKPDVEEEPATPSESCETFNWKVAMINVGRGEKVQVEVYGEWKDIDIDNDTGICFDDDILYRIKPSVTDYSKDQGFKSEQIVMVSSDGIKWYLKIYDKYVKHPNPSHFIFKTSEVFDYECWKYARPLTKEEYLKVRHE